VTHICNKAKDCNDQCNHGEPHEPWVVVGYEGLVDKKRKMHLCIENFPCSCPSEFKKDHKCIHIGMDEEFL